MRSLRGLALLCVVAAACRSEGGQTPVDDAGADAETPMDVVGMDVVGNTDRQTPTDRRACDATGPENTNAACGDGVDNDCDGFLDCNDFDCSRAAAVTICGDGGARTDRPGCDASGQENTNARCTDGIDNDCDGFLDCNDFDCSRNSAVTVCGDGGVATDRPRCDASGAENTAAACNDGIDNDCNGFVDCNDFACQTCVAPNCTRDGGIVLRNDAGFCACGSNPSETTNAACSDGVDNDCDGFTDCRDFDCSRSTTVTVCGDGGTTTDRPDVAADMPASTDATTTTDAPASTDAPATTDAPASMDAPAATDVAASTDGASAG